MAEDVAQKRKGRVCECFIVALPVEVSGEQREALTRAFAERLTGGVAGYVVAIHDQQGNDQNNPHFHLVAFDVMIKSGGRGRPKSTLGMARRGALDMVGSIFCSAGRLSSPAICTGAAVSGQPAQSMLLL